MAITISGTDGIVGAGFTVDNSGVSVTAGVGTFSSVRGTHHGDGANLTSLPAAQLTGSLPAITAANLTNIPAANIVGVATAGLTKTGGFGGGKIIQFQYGAADSGDHSSASSSGDGADVSGMSASITLTSSSNKVLVMVSCNPYVGGSGAARYALKLFRDSTMVFEETYANFRESDGTCKATRTSYTYLDNPADTSAHTYKVALKKESGSNTVYLFNEGANAHTISLYEVDVS